MIEIRKEHRSCGPQPCSWSNDNDYVTKVKGLSIAHDQLLLGPLQAADSRQSPKKGGQQFIFQTNMILSGTNMKTSRIRRQVHR